MNHLITILIFTTTFALAWLVNPSARNQTREFSFAASSYRKITEGQKHHPVAVRLGKINGLGSEEEKIRAVISLASSLSIEEIKSLRQGGFINRLDDDLEVLFESITSQRWLEADPEGFLAWGLKTRFQKTTHYLTRYAEMAPEEALDFASSQNPADRSALLSTMMNHLATSYPAKALKLIRNSPNLLDEDSIFGRMVRVAPMKDDTEAVRSLRQDS